MHHLHFDYGTVTRYGHAFQHARLWIRWTSSPVLQHRRCLDSGGLGSCAFARHYLRNRYYFLFLWVLRCFSSPRSPLAPGQVTASPPPGFPIRTSPGRSAFAAHRRFSQLVTSFFASESHRHPPCALVNFSCSFRLNLEHILLFRSIFSVYLYFSICFVAVDRPNRGCLSIPRRLHTAVRVPSMSMTSKVVPGRLELPTSTLSV